MITPLGNRAPVAVGSTPAQTLTVGESASSVDVALYFQDPDNDGLTYAATSNQPGIVTAGMSGSTLTLTPVSAGAATVTVTAGDGNADATQTIAATVQGAPRAVDPTTTPTTPTTPTKTTTTTVQESENTLTGLRVLLQGSQPRKTGMRIIPEPADAQRPGIKPEIDPYYAGSMCCHNTFAESIYLKFICSDGYTGNVAITIILSESNGHKVQESVSFTCR